MYFRKRLAEIDESLAGMRKFQKDALIQSIHAIGLKISRDKAR